MNNFFNTLLNINITTNCFFIYPIIIKMFSNASRTWSKSQVIVWVFSIYQKSGMENCRNCRRYLHQRLHITFGYRLSLSSIVIVFEFKVLPVTTKSAESRSKIKISQLAQIIKQTFQIEIKTFRNRSRGMQYWEKCTLKIIN